MGARLSVARDGPDWRRRSLLFVLALLTLALAPASAEAASRVSADFNGDGADDLAVGVPFEDVGSVTDAGVVNVIYGAAGTGLTATGQQVWHQDIAGIGEAVEGFDSFGFSLSAGDFNGDGADDLAVGVPAEDVGSLADAGAVNLIYGAAGTGLSATGDQVWHQDRAGIGEEAEIDDRFGHSLSAGDLDGDGADDLAVGVPGESLGSAAIAGAVNAIYGAAGTGLTATGQQVWHQDIAGIGEAAEGSDFFGRSLSAADFDGDGADDLAVGVPFESVGSVANAGMVNAIYGATGTGLSATGDQVWHQDIAGIGEAAEGNDRFATSLAAGDLDGDGADDLAVGVPAESVGSLNGAGAVNAIYGAAGTGLTATGQQVWHQDIAGIGEAAEGFDSFGTSLSAGDFRGGDTADDLAVGVPRESVGSVDAGAVNAIYGAAGTGLGATGDQVWHQDIAGIGEVAESGDNFGGSLGAGNLDGDLDGADDLAVGVPLEDLGSVADAGMVNAIYGGAGSGLSATGQQVWHQDIAGIGEAAEGGDSFGLGLPGSSL